MAQQGELTFIESFTIGEFKAKTNTSDSKIQILKNQKTDKFFFSYGAGRTGAVAMEDGRVPSEPIISLVRGDDGEEFFLLHKKGSGGAEVICEL